MPVTFDNAANYASSFTAINSTVRFVLTAAANTVLLVFAGHNQNSGSISAMGYGTASMTRLGQVLHPGGATAELWGLTAPAAGANTVSVTFAGNSSYWGLVGATYLNATGTTPFGGAAVNTATATNTGNLSISTTGTDLVVVGFQSFTGPVTFNNATLRGGASLSDASAPVFLRVADLPGQNGAETASATITASDSIFMIGVPIRFSAAAATSSMFTMCLTGVGV